MRLQPIDHRMDDRGFISLIDTILQEAGWEYPDLTHIACVAGPGGFTSLRVGVAAANALASALALPACGIPLWDLYGARAAPSPPVPLPSSGERGLWWMHSTKKTMLFVRPLDGSAREPSCVTLEELRGSMQPGGAWTGELLPEHRALVETLGLRETALRPLHDVLPRFLATQMYQKETLLPWYGRGW